MGRRALVLITVGALLGAGAVSASAASGDAAHGGAQVTVDGENRTFAFTAREHDGEDRGQAQLQARQEDVRAHLDIDCLRVIGNRAVMSGTVTRSNDALVDEGDTIIFTVLDGGEGRMAVDAISLVFFRGAPPFDCEAQETATDRPVERGNVQVRQG